MSNIILIFEKWDFFFFFSKKSKKKKTRSAAGGAGLDCAVPLGVEKIQKSGVGGRLKKKKKHKWVEWGPQAKWRRVRTYEW